MSVAKPKLAYDTAELIEATGLSKDTIDQAVATGRLRAKKSGVNKKTGEPAGKRVYLEEDVRDFLRSLLSA
ncbi:hypothetical protein INN71_02520 [Nocardioides sp. ChNu-153]|uniref:hypothetical protein n=1 Tax=unclassified Nocardioides TaxID=2615069 RepID=UPI002406A50B|nr:MULTISPECIES: hypothetical protein [unclassified Nocardioides]MDF9717383.1 helix-turn-helix domain-containing protein [Nocardioides sp. ChNu-99]MDN7120259.1 hypothetical protein [Nocardioides sp. ChNu-153]